MANSSNGPRGFSRGRNPGTKVCIICGKRTWVSKGEGTDLCEACYDIAGLENEHQDGYHEPMTADNVGYAHGPNPECPYCPAPAEKDQTMTTPTMGNTRPSAKLQAAIDAKAAKNGKAETRPANTMKVIEAQRAEDKAKADAAIVVPAPTKAEKAKAAKAARARLAQEIQEAEDERLKALADAEAAKAAKGKRKGKAAPEPVVVLTKAGKVAWTPEERALLALTIQEHGTFQGTKKFAAAHPGRTEAGAMWQWINKIKPEVQ